MKSPQVNPEQPRTSSTSRLLWQLYHGPGCRCLMLCFEYLQTDKPDLVKEDERLRSRMAPAGFEPHEPILRRATAEKRGTLKKGRMKLSSHGGSPCVSRVGMWGCRCFITGTCFGGGLKAKTTGQPPISGTPFETNPCVNIGDSKHSIGFPFGLRPKTGYRT